MHLIVPPLIGRHPESKHPVKRMHVVRRFALAVHHLPAVVGPLKYASLQVEGGRDAGVAPVGAS